MTITEYAELAQRTASTKTKEGKIGHGCLGLIGEAGEVIDIVKKQRYMGLPYETAQDKLIDEMGDLAWYWVELCTGLGFDVEDVYSETTMKFEPIRDNLCDNLIQAISYILYIVLDACDSDDIQETKKRFDFEDAVDILSGILYILDFCHISFDEVIEHNIDKLSKRYPEHTFNADRSNERYV